MVDILSGVRAVRGLGGESSQVLLDNEFVAVIGQSAGNNTLVNSEAVVRGAGNGDVLANTPVRNVVWVADDITGNLNRYIQNVHYVLSGNVLNWVGAPALVLPELGSAILLGSGGTALPVGNIGYAVVAFDKGGVQTSVSNALKVISAGATQSVQLSWTLPPGSNGVSRIYRTTVMDLFTGLPSLTGAMSFYQVSGSVTTFVDTGSATSTNTPPATNLTKNKPGTGLTYYASYNWALFTYNAPKLYTDVETIKNDHGLGSDLSIAGELAIGTSGKGNEAPGVILVAVTDTGATAYQTALQTLENFMPTFGKYIVMLKDSDVLDASGLAHAVQQSQDDVKHERFYVTTPPANYTVGDSSTPGTIIYKIASFGGSGRVIVTVLEPHLYFLAQRQHADGSYDFNYPLTGQTDTYFNAVPKLFAVAFAARKTALPDTAEDLTAKNVIGFVTPASTNLWGKATKESIVTAGGSITEVVKGNSIVNRAITTSVASTEDQSISIRATEDQLRRKVREAGEFFRGKKITTARLSALERKVRDLLDFLQSRELISAFDLGSIQAKQDVTNNQKVIVKFLYKPMYSIIWIEFVYGFLPSA